MNRNIIFVVKLLIFQLQPFCLFILMASQISASSQHQKTLAFGLFNDNENNNATTVVECPIDAQNSTTEKEEPSCSSPSSFTFTARLVPPPPASSKDDEDDEQHPVEKSKGVEWEEALQKLLENDDLRNTWQRPTLEMCVQPERFQPRLNGPSRCLRLFPGGYAPVDFELLGEQPAVVRIARFLAPGQLDAIRERILKSKEVVSQGVEGLTYSPGHRGRTADGLWLLHDDPSVVPLFARIRQITALSPAVGEDFLVLKYAEFGHYAPHFDYLDPMPPEYDDGWYVYFGNRLATALLLVEVAEEGGGTLFPDLQLNIQPERGDLLLWLNADSNNRREELSVHAACPIQRGRKIAVSMWIRGNFQDGLKCSPEHPGYPAESLVRRIALFPSAGVDEGRFSKGPRPPIPRWVFQKNRWT